MLVKFNEFVHMLLSLRGARPVSIIAETEPVMRKTGNPWYGNVIKRTVANVFIGFDYSNSVNNARIRENKLTDFEPSLRAWGSRLVRQDGTLTPLVEHRGKLYLETRFLSNRAPEVYYFWRKPGEPLTSAEIDRIKTFFPEKSSNAAHQGLNEEVILRDYALENIKRMTLNGEIYEVTN